MQPLCNRLSLVSLLVNGCQHLRTVYSPCMISQSVLRLHAPILLNVMYVEETLCVIEAAETRICALLLSPIASECKSCLQVIAVMLIIRLLLYHPHVNLTWSVSKRLFLIAVLVAQRFWDDYPLRNIDFTTAWSRVAPDEAPLTIKDVNSLECILLGALGFDLFVHGPQYHSFCNELFASVHHRQAHDGGQVASLMQHHATLLQNRKIKCWYVR